MTQQRAHRAPPLDFDFEGDGDEARHHLDTTYGTDLRLGGRMGTVRHAHADAGGVAFDHLTIDAGFTFDSDAMPAIIVADVFGGDLAYTRDGVSDHVRDGDSVMASGWEMPFTGGSGGYEVRTTSLPRTVLSEAIGDISVDSRLSELRFASYVPRSPAAGARWRATVDELSTSITGVGSPLARNEATRLLAHTFLQTFPNNVVDGAGLLDADRDQRDATPWVVRAATAIIEARAEDDLTVGDLARECRVSPRSLQYAFRNHLGCSPLAYLRRVRLDLARQALRDGTATSVTDVASHYGFFNPGRFAADYRQVFQENPRQTLLRARS